MRCFALLAVGLWSIAAVAVAEEATPKSVSFTRDVRPILAENCFRCHGPDDKQRKADLRLDLEADAKHAMDGRAAVTPGRPNESELWKRITSTTDDERMPPPDSGQKITPAQIETLRSWIEQGAKWELHWSFVGPTRPALPPVADRQWPANPIDYFISARLDAAGLRPSPPADKESLIRRMTLDLTGLPPTLDEIDAFLSDESPNAYEKVVERLLASPRHGERMAWMWLEAARYADTSGYQNDGPRYMWRWRDWVIEAFNAGLSFDQFTVDQLAGDLLPQAGLEQHIATGFNRNHRGNSEGGIIPEEYQVEYVVDRVDTTATVWLALTMGCARCHDHKYDPITQREFYSVFAYFNNISEHGRAIKEGNSPPYLVAPTREQQRHVAHLDARLVDARDRWEKLSESLEKAQLAWEATAIAATQHLEPLHNGCSASFSFESAPSPGQPPWKLVAGDAKFINGKVGQAVLLDGQQYVDGGDVGNFGYFDRFSVAMWVKPSALQTGTLISRMTDEEQADGWYVQLRDGHVQVNLVKRWLDDALRVESAPALAADRWTHLTVTYDGSRLARGVRVYIDGNPVRLATQLDQLNQTFTVKEPLRLGGGGGPGSRFAGALDEVRLFNRCVTDDDALQLAIPEPIQEIVAIPRDQRTAGQRLKLRSFFLQEAAPLQLRETFQRYIALRNEQQALVESLPTVMVMKDSPQPRETRMLVRGEYNRPGESVSPGIPASFPALPTDAPANRLGFARWLVSPNNPLTARVAMNRLWQLHFGAGLVRTTEDFGVQGEPPSHPELLDWLAVEFRGPSTAERRESHTATWNLKSVQRLIVTSATYRQSSSLAAETLQAAGAAQNQDNRLLARGTRFRLSAEMLRDQALAVSGLLSEQLGGPSVKSYQPADLWKDLATDSVYDQDHGAKLYRRSLYTYWKRTVAPPSLTSFDASGREACQVRTPRTNTPLQALTLLNEMTFVEAARVMAQNALLETERTAEQRLETAFRRATSRRPSGSELEVLTQSLRQNLEYFRREPEQAKALIEFGEYPRSERVELAELAAYTAVCNLLLNLDEVVTRQ